MDRLFREFVKGNLTLYSIVFMNNDWIPRTQHPRFIHAADMTGRAIINVISYSPPAMTNV